MMSQAEIQLAAVAKLVDDAKTVHARLALRDELKRLLEPAA